MNAGAASAVVSGGASGLGYATCQRLAELGVKVFALDLQAGIDNLESPVEGVTYVPTDVTDPDAVRAAVQQAAAAAPLRVAVACAGICPSKRIIGRNGPHDPALFATTIAVNLTGTFHVMEFAAEAMASQEPVDADGQRGVIVTTASVAAFEGQVGQAAYAASKGGVQALTISAARDLASKGIRVNTIAPGIVETPMMASITPEFREELERLVPFPHRMAKPQEYARLVEMLVDNPYLNGETIRLDGSLRMPPR
ncbi:SDR family NAD(P)-dependent oxidoreductase [Corynebacterium aquilae]|uniref:3-hydroxy-2-methylbutyryl-CoA dehydrogenase n=1 Tax=Corynebacterium aquilae DSM 44791 TaxID=1431546 RepID=A0A1L7CHS6_9CORY|nr:SDR family NAD(P)-dependent oxidoreductase [Corynebacterium aquilae]APT85411.1 3-hydroxy-2-methylbutyryl-CoA dehydrogenase [Corynebacterium aquilae DSM 44791]